MKKIEVSFIRKNYIYTFDSKLIANKAIFLLIVKLNLNHIPLSRFHVYALIKDVCFSLSDLLHSVRQTLGYPHHYK